jgi:hypothetical protein
MNRSAKHHVSISNLVLAAMNPISRDRVDSHVVEIWLQDTTTGFKFISAQAVQISSLGPREMQMIRERVDTLPAQPREEVILLTLFNVLSNPQFILGTYEFGDYSDIGLVKQCALTSSRQKCVWEKKLNLEFE